MPIGSVTLPLFGDEHRRGNISTAMDTINAKFGANTLYTANIQDARQTGTGGIAFTYVPDLSVVDSVEDRLPIDGVMKEGKRMSDEEAVALIERSVGREGKKAGMERKSVGTRLQAV